MPVKVFTQMLVRHLDIEPELTVDAKNLNDLLDRIDGRYHGFRDSVADETGTIRVYVNVFLNGERAERDPASLTKTSLKDGDEVHILASVAGGAR